VALRAQAFCARGLPQTQDDDAATTLDAVLRAFYASHDEDAPCTLSVPELAALFAPGCKPENGERAILRAHRRIRGTYRERFRERRQTYGRAQLPVARWIDPGGSGRSGFLPSDEIDLRTGDLELQANADRARARDSAFSSSPPSKRRNERAREAGGLERRRASPHGVTNPKLLEVAPISPEGLLAAQERHSGWSEVLADELRRQRYHEHPAEACRAVRTLAQRETDTPLRLLRELFKRARAGDLLIDAREAIEADEKAEREARAAYGWDPDDPATHWPDLDDGNPRAPPEPTAEELDADKWAAVLRAREAELRAAARPRARDPAAADRFLAELKPEIQATVRGKS
jgi:hypothetical protein